MSQYNDNIGSASNQNDVQAGTGNELEDLANSIPGTPGQDYPILAEVPELSFTCDGRVAGGRTSFLSLEITTFSENF